MICKVSTVRTAAQTASIREGRWPPSDIGLVCEREDEIFFPCCFFNYYLFIPRAGVQVRCSLQFCTLFYIQLQALLRGGAVGAGREAGWCRVRGAALGLFPKKIDCFRAATEVDVGAEGLGVCMLAPNWEVAEAAVEPGPLWWHRLPSAPPALKLVFGLNVLSPEVAMMGSSR